MKAALPWIACLLAAACSSAKLPERFHTLLPAERAASAPAMSPVYVDVLSVGVPAQVDHAQWVVRQGDDSLLMLEQDRWAAPLADELRGALSERLAGRWGAVDIRGVASPQPSVWRVRVDVQRFESVPGREARIESVWSVSGTQRGAATLVCRSTHAQPVSGGDVSALAAAHRRAVTALADEIGQRVRAMQAGQPAGC
jgi:uncharacterized lipoprotein YmbA